MEKVTVLVPFWNGHVHIRRLLDSLPPSLDAVIVDDQSDVPLQLDRHYLKNGRVKVYRNPQRGYFSGAVNMGIRAIPGGDVLVLNQDVWFDGEEWLDVLTAPREYGIVGDGVMNHPAWPKGYVQGTFMLLRREAIDAVGKLNAHDFPLWGATAEWQVRACRKGFQALPLTEIPGFRHARRRGQQYGEGIREAISREMEKRDLFIRTPPIVSVIIPSFNHGRFLQDAINSLIGGPTKILGNHSGQTFQAFEVIVVDDASTDETAEIMEQLADPWKGIRYIRQKKNAGTPAANNAGIRSAYGRYITIMCADDARQPEALEKLVRAQEAYPGHFIYDDVVLAGDGGNKVWRMGDYDFEAILEKNSIHAGIMFPLKAWKEVGGYPEAMKFGREDWAMNIALGRAGWFGFHVNNAGYVYRRHDKNRTLDNTTPKWREAFKAQLTELFPDVFLRGYRPMGCCGNRGGAQASAQHVGTKASAIVGAEGMTLLEYMGGNYGNQSYYGPATGTRYVFSASRRIRNVDKRDLRHQSNAGLLDLIQSGGKPMFRVIVPKPAPPPPPPPEPEPLPEPAQIIEEKVEVELAAAEDIVEEAKEKAETVKKKRSRRKKSEAKEE